MDLNKNYSVLILPQNGTQIKRLGISSNFLRALLYTVIMLTGLGTWFLGDYLWTKMQKRKESHLRVQLTNEVKSLKSNHTNEVTHLKAEHNEQVGTLKTHIQTQRQKLLTLRQRINASQELLANWKDLRGKIKASVPRKQRATLSGGHVVDDLEESLVSLQNELETLIASIPSQWPTTGWLSSSFGSRRSPWSGKREFHSGLDIANRTGTPVRAPGDAVVKFAGYGNGNGKYVVLDHGQGLTTLYGHLSKIHVKKGQRVRKNDRIAAVGNTGKSTNPHLHYEMRLNGVPFDPRRHLIEKNPPRS
ncbi:MAG: peptidoglycan DD-metalloendopeptidase family protein [Deltaproteobacteria bacterium]|nr:peptidoglycan DD-metalloendopeptidase family protein [Deltaproteobacteria bacterium]